MTRNKTSGRGYDSEGHLVGAAAQAHEEKMKRESGEKDGDDGGEEHHGRGYDKHGNLVGAAAHAHEEKLKRESDQHKSGDGQEEHHGRGYDKHGNLVGAAAHAHEEKLKRETLPRDPPRTWVAPTAKVLKLSHQRCKSGSVCGVGKRCYIPHSARLRTPGYGQQDGSCVLSAANRPCSGNDCASVDQIKSEFNELKQNGHKKVVTFVGFSGQGYKHPDKMLAEARKLLARYNVNGVIVNAGGTAAGIGQVYALAKQMGFQTTGIVCWESQKWEKPASEITFFTNGKWGGWKDEGKRHELEDASELMVSVSDEIIGIGGGAIGQIEMTEAEKRNKKVIRVANPEATQPLKPQENGDLCNDMLQFSI